MLRGRDRWRAVAWAGLVACGGKIAPTPDAGSLEAPSASPTSTVSPAPTPSASIPAPSPIPTTTALPPGPPAPAVCTSLLVDQDQVHVARLQLGEPAQIGVAAQLSATLANQVTSLGRRGELLYTCIEGQTTELSAATGALQTFDLPCDAVAADADGIWVEHAEAINVYASAASLVAHTPRGAQPFPRLAPTIGVGATTLVGTLPDPPRLVRYDTTLRAPVGSPIAFHFLSTDPNTGVDLASDGAAYVLFDGWFARYLLPSGTLEQASRDDRAPHLRGLACD